MSWRDLHGPRPPLPVATGKHVPCTACILANLSTAAPDTDIICTVVGQMQFPWRTVEASPTNRCEAVACNKGLDSHPTLRPSTGWSEEKAKVSKPPSP